MGQVREKIKEIVKETWVDGNQGNIEGGTDKIDRIIEIIEDEKAKTYKDGIGKKLTISIKDTLSGVF